MGGADASRNMELSRAGSTENNGSGSRSLNLPEARAHVPQVVRIEVLSVEPSQES